MSEHLQQLFDLIEAPMILVRDGRILAASPSVKRGLAPLPERADALPVGFSIVDRLTMGDGLEAWRIQRADQPSDLGVLVDATPNQVFEVHARGGILFANTAARQAGTLWGESGSFYDLVAQEDRDWIERSLAVVIESQVPQDGQVTLVGLSWAATMDIQLVPLPQRERVMVILRSPPTHDAAAKRRAAQRRQTEQLVLLAGSIAHDLNNALTVVGTVMGEPGTDPDDDPEQLEMARGALTAAAQLGQDLQTLARGPRTAPVQATAVGPVVTEATNRLRNETQSGIDVRLGAIPDDLWVEASPASIERICRGLGQHAAQGLVFDQTVIISAEALGERVAIRVSHNGTPPRKDRITAMFDPFAHSIRGAKMGLGLAIIRALAAAHGGEANASVDPPWTHFTVMLPQADPPRGRVPVIPMGVPDKVLLVDDEDLVRRSLARMLRRKGAEVFEAKDGAAALALLQDHSDIELALVDLVMPDMDGEALLRECRANHTQVPVVVMSGWAREERATTCMDAGAVGYLSKPFVFADLVRVLEQAAIGS